MQRRKLGTGLLGGFALVLLALVSAVPGHAQVDPETQVDAETLDAADDGYGHRGDVFALTDSGRLLRVNPANPSRVKTDVALRGLGEGERLVGIDVRPANGQLYGLGNAGRVYVINPLTGAASGVSTLSAPLSGTSFGVDFNPTVDRLRVVSDTGQNLRVNVDTGATTVDTALAFASGDPNAGAIPNVVGAAYTNNAAGATTTVLYDIDSERDVLVTQTPPNAGTLNTVGSLRVNTGDLVGFDIAADGQAWASLTPPGSNSSRLYSVDLASGRARLHGVVSSNDTLVALAAAPRGAYLVR